MTRAIKKREQKYKSARAERRKAAEILRKNIRPSPVIARAGVSKGTVDRIKDEI